MAKVSNALTAYGAKGNREELADSIWTLDPTDTPFISSCTKVKVGNSVFQWQNDALRAVNLNNAANDGQQIVNRASIPTAMKYNVTQISFADATVSDRQETIKSAGRASEMAYQLTKATQEVKRDMEGIVLSGQARNDGDDSTAPRTESFEHAITTNVSYSATGANPVSATAAITDGTQRAFTKALLDGVLQSAFSNAGRIPSKAYMAPAQKALFSNFANRAGVMITGAPMSEIIGSADVYQSDFGNVTVVPHALMSNVQGGRQRTVLLANHDYVDIAMLRSFYTSDLARVGLAEGKVLAVDWGLRVRNEKAHGKVSDLT